MKCHPKNHDIYINKQGYTLHSVLRNIGYCTMCLNNYISLCAIQCTFLILIQ